MALVVGTNSWATVVEADNYLTDKVGATAWFELVETGEPGGESKESYLVTAFHWLSGSPNLEIGPTVVDDDVKNAQAEAAFYLLNYGDERFDREHMASSGVVEFEYSKRMEKLDINKIQIPPYIMGMLRQYSSAHLFPVLEGEYDV